MEFPPLVFIFFGDIVFLFFRPRSFVGEWPCTLEYELVGTSLRARVVRINLVSKLFSRFRANHFSSVTSDLGTVFCHWTSVPLYHSKRKNIRSAPAYVQLHRLTSLWNVIIYEIIVSLSTLLLGVVYVPGFRTLRILPHTISVIIIKIW